MFGDEAAARGHELVEWVPAERSAPPDGFDAAIVFGGAMNVDEEERHPWLAGEKRLLAQLLERGTPLLGVCLGAAAPGGRGRRRGAPRARARDRLARRRADRRGDATTRCSGRCPSGSADSSGTATSARCPRPGCSWPGTLSAYRRSGSGTPWGIQFHAEVTRETLGGWLDGYRVDPDAVRIGVDPEAVRAETEQRIDAWNELGRGLCERFLEAAEAATPA